MEGQAEPSGWTDEELELLVKDHLAQERFAKRLRRVVTTVAFVFLALYMLGFINP